MDRRTWIAAGAAAGATAIALAAAAAYSEKRAALTALGLHVEPAQDNKKRRTEQLALTYQIEERVTHDSDTYRHDLYEVSEADSGDGSSVNKRSVAHALLVEKDGCGLMQLYRHARAKSCVRRDRCAPTSTPIPS